MSRRKRRKQKSLSSKDNSLTKKTSLEEAEELIKKADDILSHKLSPIKKESESIETEEPEATETASEHEELEPTELKIEEAASEYEAVNSKSNSGNDNSSSKHGIILDDEKENKIEKDDSTITIDVE